MSDVIVLIRLGNLLNNWSKMLHFNFIILAYNNFSIYSICLLGVNMKSMFHEHRECSFLFKVIVHVVQVYVCDCVWVSVCACVCSTVMCCVYLWLLGLLHAPFCMNIFIKFLFCCSLLYYNREVSTLTSTHMNTRV